MTMNHRIRDIDSVTQQMLIAVGRENWDEVMQLELERRRLIANLRPPLNPADTAALTTIADSNQRLRDSLRNRRDEIAELLENLTPSVIRTES